MLSKRVLRPTALAVAVAMGITGCATIDGQLGQSSGGAACAAGATVGAVAGALVAVALDKNPLDGAAIGGAIGCGATVLYQKRVKRLQAIAQEEGLSMQVSELQAQSIAADGKKTLQPIGIQAEVQDSAMFNIGSAAITSDGQRQLRKIAAALAESQKVQQGQPNQKSTKQILVVGHTDATGSAALNQRLSEQRARAVGQILAEAGIPAADIYYQGAGASRPVADNTTEQGRAQNRRVEMTEVESQQLLTERVRSERSNPKYLGHGTAAKPKGVVKATTPPASTSRTMQQHTTPSPSQRSSQPVETPVITTPATTSPSVPRASVVSLSGKGGIDFGGLPVGDSTSQLAQGIKPKTSTFSLISPAYADAPVSSCVGDLPRVEGQVKNLATDKPLVEIATTDFFPGMNGRPWANKVNGHVASVGPVAILRDNAKVAQQPSMQFITDFASTKKKQTGKFASVANTFEGEEQILYRVFAVDQAKSPVSCMDIIFDKRSGQAVAGEMYYPKQGDAYVVQFQPLRR